MNHDSIPELLTIMIATRFLDLIVGNNRFQSIIGAMDHNSILVTQYGQSKSGDYQEVAWPWRLYCAAAIQHFRRVIFSKEGSK